MAAQSSNLPAIAKPLDPLAPRLTQPVSLAFCTNGVTKTCGDVTIYADRAPNGTQRAEYERRLADLRACLDQRGERRAVEALQVMVASMPSASSEGLDATLRAAGYTLALGEQPSWAIAEVATGVLRRKYPEHLKFAPTPPEMLGLCERLAAPIKAEIEKIELILMARVVDPPSFERIVSPIAKTWAEIEAEKRKPVAGWSPPPDVFADLERRRKLRESSPTTGAEDAA